MKNRKWIVAAAILCASMGRVSLAGSQDAGAGKAELIVITDPAAATVWVDGDEQGKTPLQLGDLLPGEHRIRLLKTGFLENRQIVVLEAGKTREVRVRLIALSGTPASAPASAEVKKSAPRAANEETVVVNKGGSKKWIFIAAGAAVAGGVGYKIATKNSPPVASGKVSGTSNGLAKLTDFSFDGSASSDPDKDSLTYNWDFGDNSKGTGQKTTHVFQSAGTYAVTLTVSDDKKSSPIVTVGSITVTDVQPPAVDSGATSPNAALAAITTVPMRAQTVSDPDGDTLSFGWSYGDGASGNGGTTDHQYQSASTYTVTLTTKDSKNNQATSTAPALVKSMTGRWSGYVSGWGSFTVNLTQSGTNITGTYSDSYGPGTISSYVYAPRNTYMKVTQVLGSSTYTLTFNCSVDATVDRCGSILTRN